MTSGRFVLLGLGHARSRWLADVSQWATSGVIGADFSKCVSASEVRSRLQNGRRYSGLLLESGVAGVDKRLVEEARRAGAAVILIGPSSGAGETLGVSATLPTPLAPADLERALTTSASRVQPDAVAIGNSVPFSTDANRGTLIAVCGSGGTGTSTLAIALAQGLAADPVNFDLVCLVDLARRAEQSALHDAPDLIPGFEELLDIHRHGTANDDDVVALTHAVSARGYRLLLGQRRAAAWTTQSLPHVRESIHSLRRTFRHVVADVTADFEGEAQSGSLDVEERNTLARTTTQDADVVMVVGNPGLKGTFSLISVIKELVGIGVDLDRVLPVINGAPKRGLERAALTRSFAQLALPSTRPPVFVAWRNEIEAALQDGHPFTGKVVTPAVTAVSALLQTAPANASDEGQPELIAPGSLGMRSS